MKAILWPYRFKNMLTDWSRQIRWIVDALQKNNWTVIRHHEFLCTGLEDLPVYNLYKDVDADLTIYNHADLGEITEKCLQSKLNWFMKPTVPDNLQCTLDQFGYGPYSSITFDKPRFDDITDQELIEFFNTKVKAWVASRITKWAGAFKTEKVQVPQRDFILVLGQCDGDTVVTKMSFGSHVRKLEQIVAALVTYSKQPIVVKLHPYMDGRDAKDDKYSAAVQAKLEKIHGRVFVYRGQSSIHQFLPHAKVVMLENSGAGFETMMHGKPIISWGWPEYHWVTYPLRLLPELPKALSLDWFNKEAQDKFLYWYMIKYCFYDAESGLRRVQELLKGMV